MARKLRIVTCRSQLASNSALKDSQVLRRSLGACKLSLPCSASVATFRIPNFDDELSLVETETRLLLIYRVNRESQCNSRGNSDEFSRMRAS